MAQAPAPVGRMEQRSASAALTWVAPANAHVTWERNAVSGRRTVGLDIGTTGVRAAQISWGKDSTKLERIGQVALPPGVVRDGEVVDPDAVGAALKEMWSRVKFATKKVVVGVANQKVVVRQVDL